MSKSKKNAVLYPDNKNGIYLYEYPMINGIKQYVQVRGADRKNPLILFLHGGPGGSLAGLCHVCRLAGRRNSLLPIGTNDTPVRRILPIRTGQWK